MGLGRLLMPIALFGAVPAVAQDRPPPPAAARPAPAIIVLDASKSMWAKVGGQSKVVLVRSGLGQAFDAYKDRIAFGLLAFGHREAAACADSQLLAKAGELNAATQGKLQFGAGFKPKASKPIAAALVEAAKTTDGGSLDLVLITDGLDTCKANVCATAAGLKQAAPGLRIHVIGFDPKAKAALKPLACIATSTGGQFLTAANAGELKQDLAKILDSVVKPVAPVAAAPIAAATPAPLPPAAAPPPAPPAAPAPQASPAPPPGAALPAAPPQAVPPPAASPPAAARPGPQQSAALEPEIQGQTDIKKSGSLFPKPGVPATGAPSVAPTVAITGAAPQALAAGPSLPVPVTFKALLTEAGPKVQSGLIWRVFSQEIGPNGARKLVSTHREANPTAALLPGEYLVNAAYGLSNLTRMIKVEGGRSLEETFVLNTGGLKLAAVLASGEPLPQTSVHFDILSDEEDQFGNRHKILGDAKPGLVIRLNAGAYHIVSLYGDANATVRADVTVEPGKITEATVKHAAAPVTFKLVQTPGGEALADTGWSILTTTGDVVKENTGALPTHILAAGNYAVVASHNGVSYTNKFTVATGQAKQIEVVMEEGPASPEALKAITEPPPPPPTEPAIASPGMLGAPPPDSGMAFGGGDGATPHEPGLFPNPGALLRPRLP
jgi:hypothetical protein